MRRATAEMEDGTQIDDDPKSEAGKRPISLPRGLRADIELHLAHHAEGGPDGRLFVGPQGGVRTRRLTCLDGFSTPAGSAEAICAVQDGYVLPGVVAISTWATGRQPSVVYRR